MIHARPLCAHCVCAHCVCALRYAPQCLTLYPLRSTIRGKLCAGHNATLSTPPNVSTISIVGAGAVGRSLGLSLVGAGFEVAAVVSAHRREAGHLAILVGAPRSSDRLADLPDAGDVFVCVPDDAIAGVARALAALDTSWSGRLVAHTSGSRPASVLDPVAAAGALTVSFHPLLSFPHEGPPVDLAGAYVGIEGPDDGAERANHVARALGMRPVRIPTNDKPRYHLAASIASNYLTTLLATVDEVLGSDGPRAAPRQSGEAETVGSHIFLPLIRETLDNIERSSPENALTGPVARGDVSTVRMHIDALRVSASHLLPLYAVLATETVRVAVRGRHLSPEVADEMLGLVSEAVGGIEG